MACIVDIKLEASDVIALLALLVAGLSALYARLSWGEAKRANQISMHGHKREIYDAFDELKMHMTQKAESAEQSEVYKFYYPSKNAKIYLPSELAQDIERYFDACSWIANNFRKYGGITSESFDKCKQNIATEMELAPKIEKELIKLLKEPHS